MNILVLEDQTSVSIYMKEALRMDDHLVLDAHSIYEAQNYWENKQVDCIIADLNMSPEGLKPEDVDSTISGMLSGWVWIKKCVLEKKPEMRHRIIIYSDFKDELEGRVNKNELEGIFRISKSDPSGSAIQLLAQIRDIAKRFRK